MNDDERLELTASLSNPSTHDDILVHIIRTVEQAEDKQAAIDDLVAAYPGMTQQVRDFLEVRGLAEGLRTDEVPSERRTGLGTAPFESLGEYRIVRRITRGGMGEIYEAYHELLRRRVAVKVIRPDKASPDARRRFAQEQRVLARLHQTHIVSIYSAGREGEVEYFVMPFIEGATLQQLNYDANRLISGGDDVPPLQNHVVRLRQLQVSPADARLTPRQEIRLAEGYVRSIAEALRELSNAVHEAHEQGIVHRDLKTSNVMIDVKGHAWLIDFGLATLDGRYEPAIDVELPSHEVEQPLTQGPIGTPPYMAPEQFDQKSDRRTDVWGLGVMLYQLLTLRPPFECNSLSELESLIRTTEPLPSAQLVSGLAPDLQAICLKALEKSPERRYQTALEFSEDLRHWLRREPTAARPLSAIQRARLWSRRNRGWAAAILSSVFGLIAFAVTQVLSARNEAEFQKEALASSKQIAAQKTQQTLALIALRKQAYPRVAGWSTQNWAEFQGIEGELSRADVQPVAAGTLAGLDAVSTKDFPNIPVTYAAWDSNGRNLVMNSGDAVFEWSSDTDEYRQLASGFNGPVAFEDDDTPVQLRRIDDSGNLELVGVKAPSRRQSFSLPEGHSNLVLKYKQINGIEVSRLFPPSVADDVSVVAALTSDDKSQTRLVVWNGRSGMLLQSIVLDPERIESMALCADLAAIGYSSGTISVWSLSTGRQIRTLSNHGRAITCLHFASDYVRSNRLMADQHRTDVRHLLASGDRGGTAVVWDLGRGVQRAICHGGEFGVTSVHFSLDGSTLAVASHGVTQIWDSATGRHLLDLAVGSPYELARLSPQGTRILLSNQSLKQTAVWHLNYGRGIQLLRGLRGQVSRVFCSQDGETVAAVSQDWTVGVWSLQGSLLHVFPLAKVWSADNAAIAFNSDATLLATSSGEQADLWDLKSGELKQSWTLPVGFVDMLAFPGESHLLLTRKEMVDNRHVFRVRNLLANKPMAPIAEVSDFRHAFDAVMSRDGSKWAIDGLESVNPWVRSIRSYDTSGRNLFRLPVENKERWGALVLDSNDDAMALHPTGGSDWDLIEIGTGKLLGSEQGQLYAMARGGKKQLKGVPNPGDPTGSKQVALYSNNSELPDIVFELGRHVTSARAFAFSQDGRHAAWGNRDGTVTVCDFVELQRRLAELGLGW